MQAASHSAFRHFSTQLYCSGAEEQRCPDGSPAGTCYWHRPSNLAGCRSLSATPTKVGPSGHGCTRLIAGIRRGAARPASATLARRRRPNARGKRIHFAGDSTTPDTFYEFAAVAGFPMFSDSKFGDWPDGAYEPRSPITSAGRDRSGECLGNYDRKKYCLRDERHASPPSSGSVGGLETRFSFQFLMQSNSSWEVDHASKMLADRKIDAAFVQCPIYEWFRPDAYNYSKTKEERARVVEVDELAVGPEHWAGMGISCAQYIDNVIRPAIVAAAADSSAAAAAEGARCRG